MASRLDVRLDPERRQAVDHLVSLGVEDPPDP